MIYTPENTHPSCVFTREDTDILDYSGVLLVDTEMNKVHKYNYPLEITDDGTLISTEHNYFSIDIQFGKHGLPIEFVLKGLMS